MATSAQTTPNAHSAQYAHAATVSSHPKHAPQNLPPSAAHHRPQAPQAEASSGWQPIQNLAWTTLELMVLLACRVGVILKDATVEACLWADTHCHYAWLDLKPKLAKWLETVDQHYQRLEADLLAADASGWSARAVQQVKALQHQVQQASQHLAPLQGPVRQGLRSTARLITQRPIVLVGSAALLGALIPLGIILFAVDSHGVHAVPNHPLTLADVSDEEGNATTTGVDADSAINNPAPSLAATASEDYAALERQNRLLNARLNELEQEIREISH
jgi:hypothetical protein